MRGGRINSHSKKKIIKKLCYCLRERQYGRQGREGRSDGRSKRLDSSAVGDKGQGKDKDAALCRETERDSVESRLGS